MIISFQHKGLENFYRTGSVKGIQARHAKKLSEILLMFDSVANLREIHKSYRLHRLKGQYALYHAIWVDKNWRVIFQFELGNFELIDYLDYH